MDSQSVEVLGRNRLIGELVLGGVEVALPVRDRGVDLVAYIDLAADTSTFVAVPIQMKASSKESFSVNRKYEKVSNLIIAYVWGLQSQRQGETYALTYQEALAVAEKMGWTKTASWQKGYYVNGQPGKKLRSLLAPYLMTPRMWREKITEVSASSADLVDPAAASSDCDISAANIAKLTAFLPKFAAPEFKPILKMSGGEKLPNGATTFYFPEYDPTVVAFFEIAMQSMWTDTEYDPEQAGRMLQDERVVANASIAQIRTMLTYCTRGERFCDGHWAAVIENGYVGRLLVRLLEIGPRSSTCES